MNSIFKYKGKYLTKDLQAGYNGNNFSLLTIYLNKERLSVTIQFLNIFKYYILVAWIGTTEVSYDRLQLFNAIWMKFYNSHGKNQA